MELSTALTQLPYSTTFEMSFKDGGGHSTEWDCCCCREGRTFHSYTKEMKSKAFKWGHLDSRDHEEGKRRNGEKKKIPGIISKTHNDRFPYGACISSSRKRGRRRGLPMLIPTGSIPFPGPNPSMIRIHRNLKRHRHLPFGRHFYEVTVT